MSPLEPIAILCGGGPHHDYLLARIASRWPVALAVREPESRQLARVRARARKATRRWAGYHALRRKFCGLDRFRRRYFEPFTAAIGAPEATKTLTVDDINSAMAVAALLRVRPTVTLVMGTSILKDEVLCAAGKRVLNVHGGLLPYYRGNHCVFFALYEGRTDLVGATVHFIDAGVDTGPIVDTVRPPDVSPNELPESAYCRSVHAAVDCLVVHLERLEAGVPLPSRPQPAGGRTFRIRDRRIGHDLRHLVRRTAHGPARMLRGLGSVFGPIDR